jgi:peptidoglycan/LPS O-acetylase OafA/YrhL
MWYGVMRMPFNVVRNIYLKDRMKREFKVNNFDVLRLFAATEVLVEHSFHHLQIDEPFWVTVYKCFSGVPVFFVISGYLISASLERSKNIKNYLTNRFLRICPGFWTCILFTVITAAIVGKINFVNLQAATWLLAQFVGVIYTPAFLSHYGFGSYNGALWTIPVEVQFYLVLPVIYFLLKPAHKKNGYIFALLVLFLSIAFYTHLAFPDIGNLATESKMAKLIRYSFVPHFYMFLCGVLMQRTRVFQSDLIYGKGLYWTAAFLCYMFLAPDFIAKDVIAKLMLSVTTISLAYTRPGFFDNVLKGNDISYGIYIYHGVVLNVIVELNKLHSYTWLTIAIVCTYILAFLSWKFIEKPMLRRKKVTIHSMKPPEPVFATTRIVERTSLKKKRQLH